MTCCVTCLLVQMKNYEWGTLQHVVDRYQLYNTDEAHLASFSVPLLEAVLNSLDQDKQQQHGLLDKQNSGPAVSVFSCHDTNLLGVLYALRKLCKYSNLSANIGNIGDAISWPGFGMHSILML